MYKSPVEIWVDDFMNKITTQIQENNEMQIMTSINQYVAVDKEELIKALNYDRQQYEKGYADAKAEYQRSQGEWIRYRDNPHQPEHIKCSNCGQYWSIADHDKTFDFCFKCGADMRGKENDRQQN